MKSSKQILLKNVSPVSMPDHASGGSIDVLIDEDGRIAATGKIDARPDDAEVIDCHNAFVSPGWMDLHVHIYHGATDISIRSDECGLSHGVTTLVDAGSAGDANFPGFREFIVDPSPERIFAMLNIGTIGLVAANRVSEVPTLSALNLDRTLACIEQNRDIIRGVKVRASRQVVGTMDMLPVKFAKKAAELSGLPLMVHIGDPPCFVEDILDVLTSGDIITHCYHNKAAGTSLLDNPALFARAERAAKEGVLFDIGHGRSSLSYAAAEFCLNSSFPPTTISTDIHIGNLDGAVVDFAHVLSKFLALGMPLESIIGHSTIAPRKALNLPADAFLSVGAQADLTVFDIEDCEVILPDSRGDIRPMKQLFAPRYAVLGSKLVKASRRLSGASK